MDAATLANTAQITVTPHDSDPQNVTITGTVPATGALPEFTYSYNARTVNTAPGKVAKYSRACDRCDGYGRIMQYESIVNGTCFKCNKAKFIGKPKSIASHTRSIKKALARVIEYTMKQEERSAARKDGWETFRDELFTANPDLPALIEDMKTRCAKASDLRFTGDAQDDFYAYLDGARNLGIVQAWNVYARFEYSRIAEFDLPYFIKTLARLDEREELKFVGAVGEKVTVTGTVRTANTIDTRHGYTTLFVVEVDGPEAAVVKFFSTARWTQGVSKGDKITFTATVKEHEDSARWGRSTLVTRPKAA